MFAHHIVAHASFARVISWSSHDERNSSTFESSISFYFFFFFSFIFNFLHFFHNFGGSSNIAYFAWKKMDPNDKSYFFAVKELTTSARAS